jgi:hypothetical protein
MESGKSVVTTEGTENAEKRSEGRKKKIENGEEYELASFSIF